MAITGEPRLEGPYPRLAKIALLLELIVALGLVGGLVMDGVSDADRNACGYVLVGILGLMFATYVVGVWSRPQVDD